MSFEPLADRLRQHVEELAATPRPPESAAHRRAGDYIRARFQEAGFIVDEQPFDLTGHPGLNLLTRPQPENSTLPLVIIGAHYDSIPDSPGADDNASGVAALLELASWMGPRLAEASAWKARLLLAAYDQEEYGLVGSTYHSMKVREPVRGMMSLEMLGYIDNRPGSQQLPPHLAHLYPDVGNFIGVVGNQVSRRFVEETTTGMRQVKELPIESMIVPGNGEVLPETRLSDHASFWDAGQPALMITDTSFFRNPHYHQPSDTPATLDYLFLAHVTTGVCLAVERLLLAVC
jgi:Zn-dependent M28 family amino/carboxypeptidase